MFYVGLDLGQRRDHSAIVVVQKRGEAVVVRHIERVPLGTSYPRVVSRVRQIARDQELVGRCSVVVDGTGVGAPVVEMLRSAQLGCGVSPVTITGGEREHSHSGASGMEWNVPKQDLMAGVQVLLERGELKIARSLKESGTLVRELMDVRAVAGRSGRMKMGANGHGQHDDLVIALALACWKSRKKKSGFGNQRLIGI